MTLRKKVLFYALLTLLTLAAVEGISRLAYYLAFAESAPPPPTLSAAAAALAWQDARLQHRVAHPYYGFTPRSLASPLNTMPPPQTGPDTVIIGILGGSVAEDVAPYFQQALTRHFADQGLPKEPAVVPWAYRGMKQPQQLYTAAFMLAMGGRFDILVNLDGHNEMRSSYLNFTKGAFPFFPVYYDALFARSPAETLLVGQIRVHREQLAQLQQAAPASPFRHTALYALLHRYQLQQAETRILQLNYELANHAAARSLEPRGPYIPFPDTAQVHQETVRVWYRSSALLSRLAAAGDADYYHFLQPNQYIPNSKPLSPTERRDHYRPSVLPRTDYARTYPLLVQFGQELRQHGVHYFDLAQIFNDHPETLYNDACCHLNPRGNELLAAAMVERLSPALRRRANGPGPATDGTLTVAAPLPLEPAPALASADLPFAAATEPDYQVSRRPGNLLFYTKKPCAPAHTADLFFLHITPADPADLPPDRSRHGFESRGFLFAEVGVRSGYWGGRQCIIEYSLPDYPIAHIRTGQYNPAGEIWSVELTFPP